MRADPDTLYIFSDEAQFFTAREAVGEKGVCAKINDTFLAIYSVEAGANYSRAQNDLNFFIG